MNGNETGTGPQSARDLTEEIDRAADAMLEQQRAATGYTEEQSNLASVERQQNAQGNVANGFERFDRGQAGNFGNKILTYNPEADANTERVREMVMAENGENDGRNGESALQIKEREAWNKENLLNELDPKRDAEAKMVARDQLGIGREVANIVEEKTKTDNFRIMDLIPIRSKGRDRELANFENPRVFGSTN